MAIAEGLADFLEPRGHLLDFAYRGDHALALLDDNQYDLVLLDINLPGASGVKVCEAMKQQQLSHIPVLMMTANDNLQSKLAGFAAGAWDYLVKPFSFQELDARIKVLLHLSLRTSAKPLSFNDLTLNEQGTVIRIGDIDVNLSASGLVLIKSLIQSATEPVGHQELCRQLWGEEVPDSSPLRAHIYQLRKLLEQHHSNSEILLIKGVGYCLQQVANPKQHE